MPARPRPGRPAPGRVGAAPAATSEAAGYDGLGRARCASHKDSPAPCGRARRAVRDHSSAVPFPFRRRTSRSPGTLRTVPAAWRHLKVPMRVESCAAAPGTKVPARPGSAGFRQRAGCGWLPRQGAGRLPLGPVPSSALVRGLLRSGADTAGARSDAARRSFDGGSRTRGARLASRAGLTMGSPCGEGWLPPGALRGGSLVAEPSAAAPSGVAASGPDVLLATKLHVPRPRPGFVPRPRLVQALGEGLARRLILVCAPAGFGKTALLAGWAPSGNRPVAWLSLDAADNDPVRFWRHTVAALDRARPGIGERVGSLLGPPAPASFEGLVTALINDLAAQPDDGEVLLVLDDYHLIDAQPVHTSLEFLLEHLPPGLHLVLASRSDPPLPLARLRAGRQLAELRTGDLRFTAEEAAALLREAIGGDLPGAVVAALAARTEGWAAGLQLAGLSLRGQPDVTGFVAAFSGSHRYVLDYLAGEVLAGQTDRVREFLLETSVLERLSGRLCDAVTGRTDSQAMLEQVERANLFLVPLDEVRGWWRYHHLFADLLRARLQQQHPDRLAALHRNAAAWSAEHGLAGDAVRHAVAAGEMTWAARLVEQYFDAVYILRSEGETVQRWLAALPAELVQSRPRLLLAQALLAATSGRAEAVEPPLEAAERALAGAARAVDERFEPSAGRAASMLVNVPALIALHRSYLAQFRGDAEA